MIAKWHMGCSWQFVLTLAAWAVLSTGLWAGAGRAHEVSPIIGDFFQEDGRLRFVMTGSFEPIVAGVNLAGLSDVNESPLSGQSDALRALPPSAFAGRIEQQWPILAGRIGVIVDDERIEPRFLVASVRDMPGLTTARESEVIFAVDLPPGAKELQIVWPADFGVLVLRQMGVEDGWSGYLAEGRITEAIPLEQSRAWWLYAIGVLALALVAAITLRLRAKTA